MSFNTLKVRVLMTFATIFVFAFAATTINAQSGTARVSGTVADASGAVVPGATVILINPATGFTRTQVTEDDGKI